MGVLGGVNRCRRPSSSVPQWPESHRGRSAEQGLSARLTALLAALACPNLVACSGDPEGADSAAGDTMSASSDTGTLGDGDGDGDGDEDSCNFDPCEGEEPGMACIQGSTFPMGQPPGLGPVPFWTRAEVEVCVSTFWMDRTKVSWAAYGECVAAGVCTPVETSFAPLPEFEDQVGIFKVSWFQARDYCAFAGKRLPTEAEWERAARAGDQRAWPWGDEPDFECGVHGTVQGPNGPEENICSCENPNGEGRPLIGAYPEGDSPEGIESLAGFPGEWVLDWTAENSEIDDVTNPMGPSEGTFRTVKGSGGTCFVDMPIPPPMWSTGGSEPDSTVGSTGFRCVKPLGSAGDSSPTEPQVHEGNH